MNNTSAFAWRFIVPMVAGVLIALIGVIVHNLGYNKAAILISHVASSP